MGEPRPGPDPSKSNHQTQVEASPAVAGRVTAIVTAFRPEASLIEHCRLLKEQVAEVVVVDDGSGPEFDNVLSRIEVQGVSVIRLPENAGIANAINHGYKWSETISSELVITFDQDSRVTPGFIAKLVTEYDRRVADGLQVGMVAPEYFAGFLQTWMPQKRGFLEAYQPIQSGLLMPLDAIHKLGPQRADYFIDCVDTEYYQRAIRHGYDCICAPGLDMPHSLGEKLYVKVLGRFLVNRSGARRTISVSSPFRYYYRVRNRIVMNREYLWHSPRRKEMIRDSFKDFLHFVFVIYCCRGKRALLSILLAGLSAGVRNHMGKIPPKVARKANQVSWRHRVNVPSSLP